MNIKKYYSIILVSLLVVGCSIPIPYVKKSDVEKQIIQLKEEYNNKISNKEHEISNEKDNIITGKDKQIKAAVNGLFAADKVFQTIITPTRTDLITNNYVNESWTALAHQMPDYETVLQINERLKNELDETKTSLVQLQKTHEKIINENQKLVDETNIWKDKLSQSEKEKSVLNEEYRKNLDNKQTELIGIQNKIIVLEKQRSDEIKATREAKLKAIGVLGGLAVLCIAGAVWSPLAKEKFAIMAAIFGICAVGIWYLQPWMVITFFGMCALLVSIWILVKLHITDKSSTNVYRAIQSIKEKLPEEYAKIIKPELDSWQTKYDKNGKIVSDKQSIKHVDDILMQVGDK